MHLPKFGNLISALGGLFAGLVRIANAPGRFPALAAKTTAGPKGGRNRLVVLAERTKVMRPRRWPRDGKRQLPAETARLVICTHAPHGKSWPRKPTPITEAWGIGR